MGLIDKFNKTFKTKRYYIDCLDTYVNDKILLKEAEEREKKEQDSNVSEEDNGVRIVW